jgi:hypothetical protein
MQDKGSAKGTTGASGYAPATPRPMRTPRRIACTRTSPNTSDLLLSVAEPRSGRVFIFGHNLAGVSQLNDFRDSLSEDIHLVEIIKRVLIGVSVATAVIYILKLA